MQDRIKKELETLSNKYKEIEVGENLDYVIIKNYSLPDVWNKKVTEIFFAIPAGYPSTKPDNFSVPAGLKTKNGAVPGNYSEAQNHHGKQWGQFSYHMDVWKPTPDINPGHNLLTFVAGIESRLKESN